jgi:hypothetical protein
MIIDTHPRQRPRSPEQPATIHASRRAANSLLQVIYLPDNLREDMVDERLRHRA